MGRGNQGNRKADSIPPDGGWGWMVAFGCALIVFLLPVLTLSFSILFSSFLRENDVSATTTAWIFNSHILFWNIMGPFCGPLTKEFGFRRVSMTGAIMASISVLACAFSKSTVYLLVFFSLAGLFGGLTCKPCYLIIPLYFDKRRGRANAILMAGMCFGQFAGPPFIRYLLQQFGFTGATLIVSAFLLNCCIGASFFHPIDWHLKPIPSYDEKAVSPFLNGGVEKPRASIGIGALMNDKEKCHENEDTHTHLTQPDVLRVKSERRLSVSSNVSSIAISMVDLSSVSHQREDKSRTEDKSPYKETHLVIRVIKSLISDLGILRYHRAQIIAFGGLFFITSYLNFMMVAPFAIQAAGHSLEDAAWCVSITGVCNFLARLGASVLSDYSWFNMQIMYIVGAVIVATATGVFSILTSLIWMKVTLAIWSLGIGINISLYPLVMARVMGVENMAAIFGTQSLIVGIGYIVFGPLIGYVRDASGSDAASIWLMTVDTLICVIVWCFMPAAIRRDRVREASDP